MPQWFWFMLPPLVGAIIGLFTNWLAIKMLFRPRYEKRLLGLRIPFTPGILPRERQRLAASLGETAAGDLLTEDVLAAKIRSSDFRLKLQTAILESQESILAARFVAPKIATDSGFLPLVQQILKQSIQSLGGSAAFRSAAESALRLVLEEISNWKLLDSDASGDAAGTPELLVQALLTEDNCRRLSSAVLQAFNQKLQEALEQGLCAADFFKPPEPAVVSSLFDYVWPLVARNIVEILKQKKLRRTLEKTGVVLVRRIIDRLNSVQRFFMGLGGYDRSILESMPDIIDDFVDSAEHLFNKPETKADILDWLQETINTVMHKPLSDQQLFADHNSRSDLFVRAGEVLTVILLGLRNERTVGQLVQYARQHTLGDVFDLFPQLKPVLTVSVGAWLSRLFLAEGGSARSVSRVMHGFFDELLTGIEQQPVGEYLVVRSEQAVQLAEIAAAALAGLAATHSARIIQSVDVRGLVEDRINDLSIESVERMILKVMDRELRAVTWFGALLGGLLGLAQTLLNLLR